MSRRFALKSAVALAAVGGALAAGTVGAQASTYHLQGTYLHYYQCAEVGIQGVQSHQWSSWYCDGAPTIGYQITHLYVAN